MFESVLVTAVLNDKEQLVGLDLPEFTKPSVGVEWWEANKALISDRLALSSESGQSEIEIF